ncbi:MAG: thioredoxin family protein [Cyanobacteria bacterium]|nr:thioredoxin family protein [Cyanobacteriota bacterium]
MKALFQGLLVTVCIISMAWGSSFSLAHGEPELSVNKPASLINPLARPYQAPALKQNDQWFNSQPLTLQGLKGKVVLIDFWTYSCINCLRTLPHITAWDREYRSKGLVILGIHTPEFDFEKKPENIQAALLKHHILYPVATDNDYGTWQNYENQYWPAHYLIDKTGKVVYTHFGEGEYEVTENNIRSLLGLPALPDLKPQASKNRLFQISPLQLQTPETYLGYQRAQNFSSPEGVQRTDSNLFSYPGFLPLHSWALSGKWQMDPEKIVAQEPGAALKLNFRAKKVFLVLGIHTPKLGNPKSGNYGLSKHAKLFLNGQPIGTRGGRDVKDNTLTITQNTLYELVLQDKSAKGTLEIQVVEPGVEAYAFTFES